MKVVSFLEAGLDRCAQEGDPGWVVGCLLRVLVKRGADRAEAFKMFWRLLQKMEGWLVELGADRRGAGRYK